jgi:hypothetical protein
LLLTIILVVSFFLLCQGDHRIDLTKELVGGFLQLLEIIAHIDFAVVFHVLD